MDDVAKHISMSKRTIYEKFPNKDSIVETLLNTYLQQHLEDFKRFRFSSANAIEEVFKMLAPMKDLFKSMNPRLLFELKKFHPRAWEEFQKFKKTALTDNLISNMKRGIKEGLYRDDIDINILAVLRLEEMEFAWNVDIYPPAEYDLGQVQICLLEHFLFGITNVKGHGLAEKYKKQLNTNELI